MKCVHATKTNPEGCGSFPEPDQMGRYRCSVCGCFTADEARIHGWCQRGGMRRWQDSFTFDREAS